MVRSLHVSSFRISVLSLAISLSAASAQAQPEFTKEQAGAGRAAYRTHCVSCHGAQLEGIQVAPGLAGERFDLMWRGRTADVLSFHLRRMPPEAVAEPGSLNDETYANLLAYILISNGFEPGDSPMPSAMDALSRVKIPAKPGETVDRLTPSAPTPDQSAHLEGIAPVTQAMRESPSPNDWLQWGRTYNGHGFSPLTQIDKDNVKGLTLAWRRPLTPGMNMPAPLVHDGVMFLHTFPDSVIAMDATNGAILWRYQHGQFGDQRLGLGLHGNKVIMATSNMHVVALDAKTGVPVWKHEIVTDGEKGLRGFRLRSAPLVVGDKVIQGVTASFSPGGGFITGIDANTGEEAWRFYTIARPDEPGGNTWNDLPLEKRSGGSVWHQGTYDPELNLVYFGAAPTYDTGPMLHATDKEGHTNDALYTNSTLALNPDTGELVWHYQHLANDQWDLDWAFERQIVEVPVNGKPRKIVMNVGKIAVLEAVDAATGEYLFSVDSGVQNFILAIDPETGAKSINPDKLPDPGRPCVVCPSAHGARSWPPTSFSPRSNMLYLPLTEICMLFGPDGVKLLTSGVGISGASHPDAEDGMMGRLQAIDVANAKLGWTHHLETPITTGVLSTAGGVVFVGDMTPSLKAFDDTTGDMLWNAGLDDLPSSSIISYGVGDRQYVALVVGAKNLHIGGLSDGYRQYSPENAAALKGNLGGGAAVWVFALN